MKSLDALNKQLKFIGSFYLTGERAFKALMRRHDPQNSPESLRSFEEDRWQQASKVCKSSDNVA